MRLSLDRYEEGFAVFVDDDGNTYNYPKADLEQDIQIGDIIEAVIDDNKIISYSIVKGERERYAQENMTLMQRLKNRKKHNSEE